MNFRIHFLYFGLALFLSLSAFSEAKKTPRELIKEAEKSLNEISLFLTTIKGGGNVKAECDKLMQLLNAHEDIKTQWQRVIDIFNDKELAMEHQKDVHKLAKAFFTTLALKQRIEKNENLKEAAAILSNREWLIGYTKYFFYATKERKR